MTETETPSELQRAVKLWAIFFMCGSLSTTILAALQGVTWVTLDTQTRFLIVIAIAGNFSNTMMAFISKAVGRAKQGKSIVNGDTDTAPPFQVEKK